MDRITTDVDTADRSGSEWAEANKTLFRKRIEARAAYQKAAEAYERAEDQTEKNRARVARDRAKRELDDITEQIIAENFGLVRSYVARFTGVAKKDAVEELEAAGLLGLMRAIDTYDPDRGSFAQWAYKPIQREVLRTVHSLDHSNLNLSDFERRPKILQAQKKLTRETGAEPDVDAVAEEAGVTVAQARRVLEAPRLESLHTPVGDGESVLGEFIPDSDTDVEEEVVESIDLDALEEFGLSQLDPRELFVLTRRLGLDCEPAQRLSAIGELLGLSREAVRQIEAKAIAKLSHPILARKLIRHGKD